MYLHVADLLALGIQRIYDLLNRAGNGTHGDDDVLSFRIAVIVEQFVRTACQLADLVHIVFYDIRKAVVPGVIGFAGLEEHVRVGDGAADDRMFRI